MSYSAGSALFALQSAVFAELSKDSILKTMLPGGIHDGEATSGVSYPYVVIGEWTEVPMDGLNRLGRTVTCVIHSWSSQRSFKQSKQIADRVIQLLDRRQSALVMTNWVCVFAQLESAEALIDPGSNRQVAVRMRWRVQAKEAQLT